MKCFSLFIAICLSCSAFAGSKEKTREPASAKKAKSITCSNAKGDGGYTVTIFNYKRATVLENNIAGAIHVANLSCGLLPTRNVGGAADMIQAFISCSGKGLNDKDKDYSIVVSHGGFAGLTEADLSIDSKLEAEDILCQ